MRLDCVFFFGFPPSLLFLDFFFLDLLLVGEGGEAEIGAGEAEPDATETTPGVSAFPLLRRYSLLLCAMSDDAAVAVLVGAAA